MFNGERTEVVICQGEEVTKNQTREENVVKKPKHNTTKQKNKNKMVTDEVAI